MADQTKEVKKKHLTNTEISDGNGSGCSNLNAKEQTRKTSNELNPSNEHSVNLALKVATSLLQSVFLENRPVVLPVNLHLAGGLSLQVGETGLSPLILPASSTVSMPLVLDQHLNSQFTPSSRSCPFANIQKNENLLLSQPEALVYHTDVPVFQSHGTATCLQDLIPSLSNYASAEYQITGQDQPISLPSNFLPHEIVQPTSTPMTPLATLLVPYPFVVPLPVPLPIPIPIPIQIPQSVDSKTFIKTSKTGSMIDKSTKTSPTISCCTSSMVCPEFPHTPSVSQDEVLDLSLKATQTKRENVKSPSPNSALDLSVVRSNSRLQNGQNTWSIHEGNGNNITRSKYEDYNGKTVRPTQTVIVTPTETAPAPLCDKRRGFSWDCMINSPTKPDRIQDTVPQDSSRRLSTAHPPCSEPQRQILNNKNVHFKRDGSQNMYGDSPPFKKQHLAYFLP